MSWRIETANPVALLRELPDRWAQTCFLHAPQEPPMPRVVAILEEVHRVLRDDGTLWVAHPAHGNPRVLVRTLEAVGWLPTRTGFRTRVGAYRVVALFSKQTRFHFHPRYSPLAFLGARDQYCSASPSPPYSSRRGFLARRAWCLPARGTDDALTQHLIEWCILASTSPRACGICGAPWKRLTASPTRPARWRPGCSHTNGRGSCLVLEPLCGPSPIGIAAVRFGRNYLGVEDNPETAARARHRLSDTRPGRRR